jgi:hypothetical protein
MPEFCFAAFAFSPLQQALVIVPIMNVATGTSWL